MEVAGNVVWRDYAAAFQVVVWAGRDQLIKVQYAVWQRPALRFDRTALRLRQQIGHVHADNCLERRQLLAQTFDLGPQIGAGKRRQSDQQFGVRGLDQLGDMFRVEQRVDRIDDPCRFAAPDGEVGVRQVGQQKRHRLART